MKFLVATLLCVGSCLGMQPQDVHLLKKTNRYCPDTHALYAIKHEQQIGFITWAGNGILELKVAENHRNKGVGGYLFCTALKHIKDDKYDHAYWYAVDSIPFYRTFGAQVIDTQDADDDNASMHFNFKQHGNPVANYLHHKTQKNRATIQEYR